MWHNLLSHAIVNDTIYAWSSGFTQVNLESQYQTQKIATAIHKEPTQVYNVVTLSILQDEGLGEYHADIRRVPHRYHTSIMLISIEKCMLYTPPDWEDKGEYSGILILGNLSEINHSSMSTDDCEFNLADSVRAQWPNFFTDIVHTNFTTGWELGLCTRSEVQDAESARAAIAF